MKIPRSSKKIPALLLYLIITSCTTQTCSGQKERTARWEVDGDFEAVKNYDAIKSFDSDFVLPERALCSLSNSPEDCEDERNNMMYSMQLWKRQPTRNAAVTSAFTANKADKSTRTLPIFQSSQAVACSCEVDHRIRDLGLLYYPRYVPMAVCKPGRCHGGYQCQPRKYKVRVLKQKQPEDVDRNDSNPAGLPEILRDLFLPVTIEVTVACECAP